MLFFLTTTFLMLGSAVAAVADGSFKKMPEISLRQWAVVALSAACVGTTVGLLFYVSSRKDGAMDPLRGHGGSVSTFFLVVKIRNCNLTYQRTAKTEKKYSKVLGG